MQLTSSIYCTRSCRKLGKILERFFPDGWRMFVVMATRLQNSPQYPQQVPSQIHYTESDMIPSQSNECAMKV